MPIAILPSTELRPTDRASPAGAKHFTRARRVHRDVRQHFYRSWYFGNNANKGMPVSHSTQK